MVPRREGAVWLAVADQRNPGGRRPPALPLPAPPDDPFEVDLPRLPEVRVDDSAEVRIDHRALAPNRNSLSGARSHDTGRRSRSEPTRVGRPTQTERPRVPRAHEARPAVPPPRSPGPRVHTAEY